jgi:hypothetical protein
MIYVKVREQKKELGFNESRNGLIKNNGRLAGNYRTGRPSTTTISTSINIHPL